MKTEIKKNSGYLHEMFFPTDPYEGTEVDMMVSGEIWKGFWSGCYILDERPAAVFKNGEWVTSPWIDYHISRALQSDWNTRVTFQVPYKNREVK